MKLRKHFSLLFVIIMCVSVFVPGALRADAASKKVNGVKAVTDRELKNWQQTDSEWGSYVVFAADIYSGI